MKLSIGMIVKNEEKHLESCLLALQPILEHVDSELIIVDTGSVDDTLLIARKYTNRVYSHIWKDDFAEARNVTIEKSKGEWYFYIDADEILESVEEMINFFNSPLHEQYKAFSICIKNFVSKDQGEVGAKIFSRRIVKKDSKLRFSSRIHEQLPPREPVYHSNVVATHYGYINTDRELMERKFLRNKTILEKELEVNPNSTYLLFHLSKTYNMYGEHLTALEIIQKAYQITKQTKTNAIEIYNFMIELSIKNGLYLDSEKVAIEAIETQKEETTALIPTQFYLAQVQAVLRKNREAIESYKKYLRLLNLHKKNKLKVNFNEAVTDFGGEIYVYSQLLILYDFILDYQNALMFNKEILTRTSDKEDPASQKFYDKALVTFIRLSIKYKQFKELENYYVQIISKQPSELWKQRENDFISTLDSQCDRFDLKKRVHSLFAELDLNTEYVFLNRTRVSRKREEKFSEEDIEYIKTINFENKPAVFSELLYFMLEDVIDIGSIIVRLEERKLNQYIGYMTNNFEGYSESVHKYFEIFPFQMDVHHSLRAKALIRAALIINDLDKEKYNILFKRYLNEGVYYLEEVYNENILEQENYLLLKNYEEIFLLYIRKAKKYKEKDKVEYIKYLRKALESYEYMHFGIQLLLEEANENNIGIDEQLDHQFDEDKLLVKRNINLLIQNENFLEAIELIDEYLKIVPQDIEMLYLKSEIFLEM